MKPKNRFRPGDLVVNAGRLHGKPERGDYHLGGCFLYLESEKQRFDGKNKPALQLMLF